MDPWEDDRQQLPQNQDPFFGHIEKGRKNMLITHVQINQSINLNFYVRWLLPGQSSQSNV